MSFLSTPSPPTPLLPDILLVVTGKDGGVSSLLLPPTHPHMASPSREKVSQFGLVRIQDPDWGPSQGQSSQETQAAPFLTLTLPRWRAGGLGFRPHLPSLPPRPRPESAQP